MKVEHDWQALLAFTTPEISDALDSLKIEGALLNIHSVTSGTKLAGPAYTIQYLPYQDAPETFMRAADYIDRVPENSVLVIDHGGREDCTVWGDILTQVAVQRGILGTLVDGAVRDIERIRPLQYPLFCRAIYMRSGKNRVYMANEQCSVTIADVLVHPGDIIFADDNGALSIPKSRVREVIYRAQNIRDNEQRILEAIRSGMSLAEARKAYQYDKPWEPFVMQK